VVVVNQQLTAAQLNAQGVADPGQQPQQLQPVLQPRQQAQPEQAPGPRVKPVPPPLFKVKPKPDGTGFKIEGPKLDLGTIPLPLVPPHLRPNFYLVPEGGFDAYPKPGKPYFNGGIGIQLEWKVGPRPRR